MSPLSGVLGEAWGYYRRFAAHFLLIAFVIYVGAAIVAALLGLAGGIGLFLGWIINLIAAFLVQAALVKAVQDVRDGRVDLNLGETVSAVVPYLLPVAAASILAGIGISIGFILIIVPGLVLLTFWSLIVPSIVIGGEGVFGSFGKSWRTVRGYAWHVFGTYVLVFLILIVFNIVLGLVLLALPPGGQELHQQRRIRHPDRAVPGPRGDADLLPAHRGARGAGPGGRRPRVAASRAGACIPGSRGRLSESGDRVPGAGRRAHRAGSHVPGARRPADGA